MQTSTSGGSRLTAQKALTVRPSGCAAASRVVTTVTPVANWPIARRKDAASTLTASGPSRGRLLQLELRGEQPQPDRDARPDEGFDERERE